MTVVTTAVTSTLSMVGLWAVRKATKTADWWVLKWATCLVGQRARRSAAQMVERRACWMAVTTAAMWWVAKMAGRMVARTAQRSAQEKAVHLAEHLGLY